jgi:hypothetical protein
MAFVQTHGGLGRHTHLGFAQPAQTRYQVRRKETPTNLLPQR